MEELLSNFCFKFNLRRYNEVKEAFSKCGVIKIDPESHGPRIKLYVDKTSGMLKERPSLYECTL
jgi:hypothetical protein